VARLVGYENVVEAEAGEHGAVLMAGQPTGLTCAGEPGPVTVAVWAAGVLLGPPEAAGVSARVTHVSPGPGRWEVALSASMPLRAHVPLGGTPPSPGDRVAVELDPARATVVLASRPGPPERG
jgi:hypothetical protein